MPPTVTNDQRLERFLTELALKSDVVASTQNQAFKAVAFFKKDVLGTSLHSVGALRAGRPGHLRHLPTISETQALFQAVTHVPPWIPY